MKKALIILLSIPALLIFNFKIIELSTAGFIHTNANSLLRPDYIVIPGAGNPDNEQNVFFSSRINSAIEIFRHFRPVKIICIGRNDSLRYHEPEALRQALLQNGVPDSLIITIESFNTFSMLVDISKNLSGRMLFISQRLHLQRILFAAGRMSIVAEGFEVNEPLSNRKQRYFEMREILASLRMTVSLAGYKISRLF